MKQDKKLQSEPVRRAAEAVLEVALQKAKYSPEKTPELAQRLSDEIMDAVKKMEYDQYKFVVEVTVGEFKGQGVRVGSRSLRDTSTDAYASATFRNATMFVVAIIFGCYFE
ncbi:Tctex1 domain-containing protein 3 [Cladochytrium tenue]|nr:Tctex1 domain-containing protein 3 [Cladochytrium tenue]